MKRTEFGNPLINDFIEIGQVSRRPRGETSLGITVHYNHAKVKSFVECVFELIFSKTARVVVPSNKAWHIISAIEEACPGSLEKAIAYERLASGDFDKYR